MVFFRSVWQRRLSRYAIGLTNLVAATASIATSPPPTWTRESFFSAPWLQIDDIHPAPTVRFVVRASSGSTPSVVISGLASTEKADANQQIRVTVQEAGKPAQEALDGVLSQHLLDATTANDREDTIQAVTAEEELARFSLRADLSCEAAPCEKPFFVTFERITVNQTVHVRWNVTATLGGDGTEPPEGTYVKVDPQ